MSGRIVYVPPVKHKCDLSSIGGRPVPGTIWECNDCKMRWVFVYGSQHNESYLTWRQLTEKNRNGVDA